MSEKEQKMEIVRHMLHFLVRDAWDDKAIGTESSLEESKEIEKNRLKDINTIIEFINNNL